MDAEKWRRVEEVLDAALTREPTGWPALLESTCSGDPELRREVEALLARLPAASGFLESPPAALAAAVVAEAREAAAPSQEGRRIGAWRIIREIGRGGMSRVFLAERADGQFEQRVALKLLRPGLDSEIDRNRFRSERQILASLSHPNIARLLDGGVTDEGQPFLVLEWVDGRPIDVVCTEGQLDVRARIELFLTVCDATQYAHRNLVVHRDLKPSNILVDRDGVVKLLDFGLARLLPEEQGGASRTTRSGQRWMTPEYAAPEQILGQPVTTVTDVYQLGAVLHQLLAGHPPYAGRSGIRELEQAILEEEPRPVSALVRKDDPALGRRLAGDLDAIVLKALRKEQEGRYASVRELADDARRHLAGRPVLARAQSAGYRTRRFIRRNRGVLSEAAALALVVSAYAVTLTVQRAAIRRALSEATLGTERAEQVTDFMLGLFEASESGQVLTDTVTARELLTRGATQAREFASHPLMQAQMLDVIGRLYAQLGEAGSARPLFEEALAIRRRELGDVHPDIATSLENLAGVAQARQELSEAIALRRSALSMRRQVSPAEHPKTIDALYGLALALHQAGQDSAASPLFDEWLSVVSGRPREVSATRAAQLNGAASIFRYRGEPARAEAMLRDRLSILRELYGSRHHLVGMGLYQLGVSLQRRLEFEASEPLLRESVELFREAFPGGHPELAAHLQGWAITLQRLGRLQESEAAMRDALELRRRFTGDNTIDVAMTELDLAIVLTRAGAGAEPVSLARDGRRILAETLGHDNSMVFYAGLVLGDALRARGDYAEAESLLVAGYRRFETPRPVTAQWRLYAVGALVRLYEATGRAEDAASYRALLDTPPAIPDH